MHKINFFLNTSQDLDLVAVTRSFLKQKQVDYNIDYYNLNFPKNFDSSISLWNSTADILLYKNNYDELMKNVKKTLKDTDYKVLIRCLKSIDYLGPCDLYCFSTYYSNLYYHLIIALTIRKKYHNARILFGGPEIMLNDSTRRLIDILGFDWSIGDVDISIYNALFNNEIKCLNNFSTITNLTEKDVPIYTDQEIKHFLNGYVRVHLSRGCNNNCYFCPTPGMYPKRYNAIKREIGTKWIESFLKQGATNIHFADSNLNAFDFDTLLNGILLLKEKYHFDINETYITLNSLTEKQIEKMSKIIKQIQPGIECINPIMGKLINKNHTSEENILKLNELFYKYGIYTIYQFIVDLPGYSDEIFQYEFNFLKKLIKYDSTAIQAYNYHFIPGTVIYNNHEDFNCNVLKMTGNKNLPSEIINQLNYIFENYYRRIAHPKINEWSMEIFNSFKNVYIHYNGESKMKGNWQ